MGMKLSYGEKAAIRILAGCYANTTAKRMWMVRDSLVDRGGRDYLARIESIADRYRRMRGEAT
jgi:hypothetical protein